MPLKLHISPCPNDTFIFHALLHGLVDCEGMKFDVGFEDIEQLNNRASAGDGDVIKISAAALPDVTDRYQLLNCGGALGFGNAPLVVARSRDVDLSNATIAIPGWRTTAALLLKRLIDPGSAQLKQYLFSEIADAVASGDVDAGVLIHEGRFTYKERGLELVADLGELWEQRLGLPVPLGVIVARRSLEEAQIMRIERTIRRSVEYAMSNPMASSGFVKCHAAELDEDVRQKHISYFVNEFSVNLGEEGHRAIRTLLGEDF